MATREGDGFSETVYSYAEIRDLYNTADVDELQRELGGAASRATAGNVSVLVEDCGNGIKITTAW